MSTRALGGVLLGVLVLSLPGCDQVKKALADRQKTPPSPAAVGAGPSGTAAPQGEGAEVAALIAQGRADAALVKLQTAPQSADTLYWQGVAWAKKAETAPLPTPPPPPVPAVRGAPAPVAPEFKPEELSAIDAFEKAIQQRADHAGASLALAQLLAPHSARRYELEQGALKNKKPVRRGTAPPLVEAPLAEGPDFSVTRVAQLYRAAVQGDEVKTDAIEAYVKFCMRVQLLDEADSALKELIRRDKEKPEPLVRYGDFLAQVKNDPQGAIEQYRQALIWKPEDPAAKARIADIYINMGIDNYSKLQYAAAEARFNDASRLVTDPQSPQGLKIRDYLGKLGAIRKLPPRR
jgi:tetratricopeptide (TPR) repeat protein